MQTAQANPVRVEGEIPYWTTVAGRRRVLRRAFYLRTLGGIEKGKAVLEVGCGVGTFTEKLTEEGVRLTAIDILPDFVQKAYRRINQQAHCVVADAMVTPFCAETFDAVVGSSILHHLNAEAALKEFWRVLRPGGRLALAEPNMLNPQIFVMKNVPAVKRWMGEDPDETAFIRWGLAHTLQRIGFQDIRIFPYDYLHPSTPAFFIPFVERMGQWFECIPVLREFAGSLMIVAKKGDVSS
ncbi:MAG: methyltransferase domain-containing protein [Candidatus Omnitrophica bacterium]|nr:methyltransferase domain-containing protein [Candidatus Omnitrophota bacterium]